MSPALSLSLSLSLSLFLSLSLQAVSLSLSLSLSLSVIGKVIGSVRLKISVYGSPFMTSKHLETVVSQKCVCLIKG